MTNLNTRLAQCFKAVFPALKEEDIPHASLSSVTEWDSIAAINLVTVIEEEFDVQIPPDDVPIMRSFGEIFEYLKSGRGLIALGSMFGRCLEIGAECLETCAGCL